MMDDKTPLSTHAAVVAAAEEEFRQEQFRAAVEAEKQRLRRSRSIRGRIANALSIFTRRSA